MKLKQVKKQAQKGFTMIELVIVIAILGILAAFALPRFANFSIQAKANTADNIVAAFNVSFAIAKTKYIANGLTGTTVDMDGNPLTTNDIIPINSFGNVNISNILGVPSCTNFINALVPNQNNITITSPRRGVCELENNNYKITLRNGGGEPAIDVIKK